MLFTGVGHGSLLENGRHGAMVWSLRCLPRRLSEGILSVRVSVRVGVRVGVSVFCVQTCDAHGVRSMVITSPEGSSGARKYMEALGRAHPGGLGVVLVKE